MFILFQISYLFCKPESFNTNISHELFKYNITFLNLQHENKNSKCDFILKTHFETLVSKISGIQK